MRLNRYLAICGLGARRKVEQFIKEGRVKVNGVVIREPWYRVGEDEKVEVDGKVVTPKAPVYVILNKPSGIITTKSDERNRKTVISLLPKRFKYLFPVGRLDKDVTGLVFLTNDGEIAHRLMHPRFEVEKEYIVTLKRRINDYAVEKAIKGIKINGDFYKIKKLKIMKRTKKRSIVDIVLTEGKKREIKIIFRNLGYPVLSIKRVRIGCIAIGRIKEGEWRYLTSKEIKRLKQLVYGYKKGN